VAIDHYQLVRPEELRQDPIYGVDCGPEGSGNPPAIGPEPRPGDQGENRFGSGRVVGWARRNRTVEIALDLSRVEPQPNPEADQGRLRDRPHAPYQLSEGRVVNPKPEGKRPDRVARVPGAPFRQFLAEPVTECPLDGNGQG
jgi:hypothetical protein